MKFLITISILISLFAIFYQTWFLLTTLPSSKPAIVDREVVITFQNGFVLEPLLSDNEFEAKRGLSGIKEPTSMLFVFDNKTIIPFWMKNMLFSIDIIWIDGETVIGFEKNLQPENPPITYYLPKVSIDAVLEVPAGFVDEHEVVVGNQLDIKFTNR